MKPRGMSKQILLLIVLSLSSASGFIPVHGSPLKEGNASHYLIEASLDAEERVLTGRLVLTYTCGDFSIDELWFHVYPSSDFFNGQGGDFEVLNISIPGVGPLQWEIGGSDGSLLRVELGRRLQPFETVQVEVRFRERIPEVDERFGFQDGVFSLGNWYPILAVFKGGEWQYRPYYPWGEAFYSLVADYDVYITVDRGYEVAATGVLQDVEAVGDQRVFHWKAEMVRDFAMAISNRFVVANTTIGDVNVYAYVLRENVNFTSEILEVTVRALRIYSELFGPYVYPELRMAEVAGWYGGMEYPMLIFLSKAAIEGCGGEGLEVVISHEVAHQWWYAAVGNDQAIEPWLDEALATYSEVIYFEMLYGREKGEGVLSKYVKRQFYDYARSARDRPVLSSVYDFGEDSVAYTRTAYQKGALVLHMLRSVIGDESFFKGLRLYAERFRFKVASTADFLAVMEEVSRTDLTWLLEDWLRRSGIPARRVEGFASPVGERYSLEVIVSQSLKRRALMPVGIYTEGGRLKRWIWLVGNVTAITFVTREKPRGVVLDEGDIVLGFDDEQMVRVELRLDRRFRMSGWLVLLFAVGVATALSCMALKWE